MSLERELRPEGSVPVSECAVRLIEATRLVLSHLTPPQLQKEVLWDQPEGVGVRASKSLDMNAPSSSAMVVVERTQKNKKKTKKRSLGAETMVLNFSLR